VRAAGGRRQLSGFDTLEDVRRLSFPIAEIHEDGTAVIGKHSGQNGKVTVDTVTAQLLYEIQGPYYLNNDVTLDVRGLHLEQVGEDRVRVSGAEGSPPPETTKVSIFSGLGYQSTSTAYLTGMQVAEKTAFVESQLADFLAGTGVRYDITRIGVPAEHPSSQWEATVVLRVITVADEAELLERYNIGAHLASVCLSGVLGYYCDEITGDARSPVRQRIEYWPGLLDQSVLDQRVEFVNGGSFPVGLPERVPFEGQPSVRSPHPQLRDRGQARQYRAAAEVRDSVDHGFGSSHRMREDPEVDVGDRFRDPADHQLDAGERHVRGRNAEDAEFRPGGRHGPQRLPRLKLHEGRHAQSVLAEQSRDVLDADRLLEDADPMLGQIAHPDRAAVAAQRAGATDHVGSEGDRPVERFGPRCGIRVGAHSDPHVDPPGGHHLA